MAKFSPLSATANDSQPSQNNRQRRRQRRTVSIRTASAENYKVGPGRPPREYQFKPGQSGNPKGAKRKPPSLLPDLKRLFEQALSEKVTRAQPCFRTATIRRQHGLWWSCSGCMRWTWLATFSNKAA